MIRTVIALITVLPLVAFLYLFNYNSRNHVPAEVMLTSATIIFCGWIVILDLLLLHMLKIHVKSQAAIEKMQANGMLEEPQIKSGVESLESVFNTLSSKVKESFDELKGMSEKIETLNAQLAKKMNALLAIMQIHEIFTSGRKEEEIFQFILVKLQEMLKLNKLILVMETSKKDFNFTMSANEPNKDPAKPFSQDELSAMAEINGVVLIDNKNNTRDFDFIKNSLKLQNIFVAPLQLRDEIVGFLTGGNSLNDFIFSKEDLDLINIFSKNIVLLWEHKKLARAVEGLEIYDPLTGLYNKKHLQTRLDEEINRAAMYQRPCGLLIAEAANLDQLKNQGGAIEVEKLVKHAAKIFKEALRPIDIAARLQENQFAAILIERNKRQCQVTVKKVKEVLDESFKNEKYKIEFRFSAGETPIDGRSSEELLNYTLTNFKTL